MERGSGGIAEVLSCISSCISTCVISLLNKELMGRRTKYTRRCINCKNWACGIGISAKL